MSLVAMCVLGAIGAVILAVIAAALKPKGVRFAFQDREDHMVLRLERHLASGDSVLITMSTLREAVRLKLGSDYRRLLIDARHLTLEGPASFWLLVGGLGPALLSKSIRVAVACRKRSRTAYEFEQARILETLDRKSVV